MRVRWALPLVCVLVIGVAVGQAGASTEVYQWNEQVTMADPSVLLGVGSTPDWWGTADDNVISGQFVAYPVVLPGLPDTYNGYGIAPDWWVGDPANSSGWTWTDNLPADQSIWISNRPNDRLYKEIVLWWKPHGLRGDAALDATNLVYLDAAGNLQTVAPVERQWNDSTEAGFIRWVVEPQPAWEKIIFTDSASPDCAVWVGTRCAPEPASLLLLGAAAGAGALVRKRRKR